MKVKDLKKKLEGLDDDAVVVVPGPDHSYRTRVYVYDTTASEEDGELYEDYGPEVSGHAESYRQVKVLVIE